MTTGTDDGASAFIGEAIGGFGDTPCIGVVGFPTVTACETVQDCGVYHARGVKDHTVALERHHTHFLLVDTAPASDEKSYEPDGSGSSAREVPWGTELAIFGAIRDRMSRERHVPLVSLVIGGTVGVLRDVIDELDSSGCGTVVVVRESGAAALAIAEFIEDVRAATAAAAGGEPDVRAVLAAYIARGRLDKILSDGGYASGPQSMRGEAEELLFRIGAHRRQAKRLCIYSLSDGKGGPGTRFDEV